MTDARAAFKNATLYTDEKTYRVIHLPAPAIWAGAGVLAEIAEPFSALIADKDEVTLVVPADKWEHFSARLPEHNDMGDDYRLITFDLPLDPGLVGFIALVSQILADAGVSILPFAAYQRDHILVTEDQFQAAWDALHAAQHG